MKSQKGVHQEKMPTKDQRTEVRDENKTTKDNKAERSQVITRSPTIFSNLRVIDRCYRRRKSTREVHRSLSDTQRRLRRRRSQLIAEEFQVSHGTSNRALHKLGWAGRERNGEEREVGKGGKDEPVGKGRRVNS